MAEREKIRQELLAFEAVAAGVVAMDRQGIFSYANPAACQILGSAPEEIQGRSPCDPIWDVIREDGSPLPCEEQPPIVALRSAKPVHDATIGIMTGRKPTRRWLIVNSEPLLNPQTGQVVEVINTFMDITERKRAEAALLESKEKFRSLVEVTTDWVWAVDEADRYTYASPKVRELLGYDPEEVIGKTPFELMPPDEANRVREAFLAIKESRRPFSALVNENIRKDGARVVLETSGIPIYNPDGSFAGYRGIDRDITERKRVEDALRESEAFNSSVLNSIPANIAVLDRHGTVVQVNESWRRFGRENSEGGELHAGVGVNYLDVCRNIAGPFAEYAQASLAGLQGLLAGSLEQFDLEYPCHSPAKRCWFLLRAAPLRGQGGDIVISHIDITERKLAEAALRESEERIRYIIKHIPNAVAVFDKEMRYILVSDRFLKDYRVGVQDIIGKNHYEVFPEIPQRWKDIHQRCLTGAIESSEDDYFVRQDGTVDYTRWECRPWYDAQGQIGGLIAYTEVITERKLAEKALRESEQRFRRLFEDSPIGVNIGTSDGRIREANDAFLKIVGYTRGELADGTLRWDKLTPPEYLHLDERAIHDVLEFGVASKPYEKEYLRKDGSRYPILMGLAPLSGSEGIIAFTVDLTELKRAEHAILERSQQLQILSHAAQEINTVLDVTVIMRRLILTAMDLVGALTGTDGLMVNDEIRITEFYSNGQITPVDYRFDRSRGVPGWVFRHMAPFIANDADHDPVVDPEIRKAFGFYNIAAVPIIDRAGRLMGIFEVYNTRDHRPFDQKDIELLQGLAAGAAVALENARILGERKRVEDALHFLAESSKMLASSLDYEATLNSLVHLAVPTLADYCVVDILSGEGNISQFAAASSNPDFDQSLGRPFKSFALDPNAQIGVSKVITCGSAELYTTVPDELIDSLAPDEIYRQFLRRMNFQALMIIPLVARGRTFGAISFASQRVDHGYGPKTLAFAEELARHASLAIDNARLYRELQEADRRKDEFLAMLAHELRNPLAPLDTSVRLMRLRAESPQLLRDIGVIERQIGNMTRIVDDLLDVSRITRGKIDLRKQPLEASVAVRNAVESSRQMIEARNHQFDMILPLTPLWFEADPTRMEQIIVNLLSNAAKYTDPGGHIWLTVQYEAKDLYPPHGAVAIRVRDTGMGISPEMLPHVFEMFAQANQSLGRAQGGLGIGLTLVRSLVQMHGGNIFAYSEGLGKGSEFMVLLPAIENPQTRLGEGAPAVAAARADRLGAEEEVSRCRVLVVDDNVDAARSLGELIEIWGHEVAYAHDGLTALELARTLRPDVILLDIFMPVMDGFEVARRLRAEPGLDGVILAALTGYGQDEDRRKTTEAGFDYHFTKPVPIEALQDLLDRTAAKRAS